MATSDSIFQGSVVVWQPDKNDGYRFNVDSLLLAGFALRSISSNVKVIELGSGSAVIGLAMMHHAPQLSYRGVERQGALVELSRRSLEEGGFNPRATIDECDLWELKHQGELADAIVFNPPYFKVGSGRPSPNQGRREAREALYGDLDAFLGAAALFVRSEGLVFAVIRPERRTETTTLAGSFGLLAEEICEVRSHQDGKHQLDLYRWVKSAKQQDTVMTRLYLHAEKGSRSYQASVDSFLKGESSFLPSDAFST